jgi:hypothetical protein
VYDVFARFFKRLCVVITIDFRFSAKKKFRVDAQKRVSSKIVFDSNSIFAETKKKKKKNEEKKEKKIKKNDDDNDDDEKNDNVDVRIVQIAFNKQFQIQILVIIDKKSSFRRFVKK